MKPWKTFWNWYQDKILTALIPSAIILYLQIPHTVSAADCFLQLGWNLIHYHPVIDFFLYGIDLLEAIPILGISMTIYSEIRRRRKNT